MTNRAVRHALLATTTLGALAAVYFVLGWSPEPWGRSGMLKAEDDVWRLSVSFAYTAALLIGVALAIGPVRVLRGLPTPVSFGWRRDVGIWAGVCGLAHAAVALLPHARMPKVSLGQLWAALWDTPEVAFTLEFWPLFLAHPPSLAHGWHALHPVLDAFHLAIYLGLLQVAILGALLATSNDRSLRWLGASRWKNLHRLVYVLWLSIAVHASLFEMLESRLAVNRALFATLRAAVFALQLAGVLARRRRRAA